MKIVDTKAIPGRRRRTYSLDFKREIVAACRKPGTSVAGVALAHGINANVVHRWRREAAQEALGLPAPAPAFVPVACDLPAAPKVMAAASSSAEIRIEVQHGNSRIVVRWPLAGAAECAAWLSEWLA